MPDLTAEQFAAFRRGVELVKAAAEPLSQREVHELATLLVDIRAQFKDAQGRPDFRAESTEYRIFVRDMYALANLEPSARQRVRGRVRHKVSQIVRERLGPDGAAAYGLDPESTLDKERARQARRRNGRLGA